jgi:hypothetical protein
LLSVRHQTANAIHPTPTELSYLSPNLEHGPQDAAARLGQPCPTEGQCGSAKSPDQRKRMTTLPTLLSSPP